MLQYVLFLNRPLSPHLTIYMPQLSSLSSIWHRLSGIFVLIFLILEFNFINSVFSCGIQNSILGLNIAYEIKRILLILSLSIFIYHSLSGIRYLIWDLGFFLHQNYLFNFILFVSCILILVLFSNLFI
uniref:Succinate:cytochrome c oxidoreductase subunit 3 n=1 Tax=Gelidium sclerophyllum TaxID=317102 RepID=A0A1D8X7J4_9FLOR|nr:succinate:cytochrome c oxidoreductase subunit 3 [Gelidium sclerophyllum]AOX48993.1 succinate:cytochrome c oxidoreductase subunit 3 [Gelidium sclerophyllum]